MRLVYLTAAAGTAIAAPFAQAPASATVPKPQIPAPITPVAPASPPPAAPAAPAPAPAAPAPFDLGGLLGGLNLGSLLGGLAPPPAAAPAAPAGGLASLLGGLDIGALLGGLGGAAAPRPAAAPAAAPGGFNLGSLLGGIDFNAIISGVGSFLGAGTGPTADASLVLNTYEATRDEAIKMTASAQKLSNATNVNEAIKAWIADAKNAENALKNGSAKVLASPGTIDLISAAGFQTPGEDVTSNIAIAIDAIVSKKAILKTAGAIADVIKALEGIKQGAQAIKSALDVKLPGLAAGIAAPEGQKGIDTLDKAIKELNA